MKKKKATDRSHRPAAINHSMTASDTQWRIDRTSAAADLQGGYVDDWDQTKRTKVEFQRLAE